jgi:hypothetical protein
MHDHEKWPGLIFCIAQNEGSPEFLAWGFVIYQKYSSTLKFWEHSIKEGLNNLEGTFNNEILPFL